MSAERVSVEKSCLVIMGSCQNLIDIASLILSLGVNLYSSLSMSSGVVSVVTCISDPSVFMILFSVSVVVCSERSLNKLRALSCCGAYALFMVWISLHDGWLLIAYAISARAVPLPLSLGDVYMLLMSMERSVFAILCRMDIAMMPIGVGRSDVVRGLGFMYLYCWSLGHMYMVRGGVICGMRGAGVVTGVELCMGLVSMLSIGVWGSGDSSSSSDWGKSSSWE